MALSTDLISQFAKVTNDKTESKKESTVYGNAVIVDGKTYVQIDGSDLMTPVSTSAAVKDGERVSVLITNHTATINGNISAPSASSKDLATTNQQVSEVRVVVAHEVTAEDIQAINATINSLTAKTGKYTSLEAVTAQFENLKASFIEGESLKVDSINAIVAEIEKIEAEFGSFEEIETEDLNAINAEITNLKGYTADFTYISAVNAEVKKLDADKANVKELNVVVENVKDLNAKKASVDDLNAANAEIEKLVAKDAELDNAVVDKLDASLANIDTAGIEHLNSIYANINFANIGEAAIKKIFGDTGLIYGLTVGDQTITGELVGVTIRGDRIIGNTIVADKLVIRGDDGLYYKLNYDAGAITTEDVVDTVYYVVTYDSGTGEYITSTETIDAPEGTLVDGAVTTDDLAVYVTDDGIFYCTKDIYADWTRESLHGSIITAESITADKISVTDLVAFGATIGGFKITRDYDNSLGTIHSLAKDSVDSSNSGIYMDDSGQFVLGNSYNFLKFYKVIDENGDEVLDEDGEPLYRLDISADSILFGVDSKTSAADLQELTEYIKITKSIDEETGDLKPRLELGEGDSDFKQVMSNVKTYFTDGSTVGTEITIDRLEAPNAVVRNDFQLGITPAKNLIPEGFYNGESMLWHAVTFDSQTQKYVLQANATDEPYIPNLAQGPFPYDPNGEFGSLGYDDTPIVFTEEGYPVYQAELELVLSESETVLIKSLWCIKSGWDNDDVYKLYLPAGQYTMYGETVSNVNLQNMTAFGLMMFKNEPSVENLVCATQMENGSGGRLVWDSSNSYVSSKSGYASFTVDEGDMLIVLTSSTNQTEWLAQIKSLCIEKNASPVNQSRGTWVWSQRSNGNLGLTWKEATS